MESARADFFGWTARVYYAAAGLYYVAHWLSALGALVPIGAGLGWLLAPSPYARIFVWAAAAGLALGAVGVYLQVRGTAQRLQSLNPGLEFIRADFTYQVPEDPKGLYRHTVDVAVRAVADNQAFCNLRFGWTGLGPIRLTVTPDTFSLRARRYGLWDVAEVHFPYGLAKGHAIDFKLQLEMRDDAACAIPHLSKLINEYFPNGFQQRVILPPRLRTADVHAVVYPPSDGNVPVKAPTTVPCDSQTGSAQWFIPRPRFGFRYRLEWGAVQTVSPGNQLQNEITVPARGAATPPPPGI